MIKFQSRTINITFEFTFFAAVAVMVLLRESQIAVMGLISCLLHEFGHLIACRICKTKVTEIGFCFTGIYIRKTKSSNCGHEIFILSAGILCNIIIALILFSFQSENFRIFAVANVMVACFNLLPFRQFDGGQLRELIAVRYVKIEKVNSYITIVNILDIILIVIVFVFLYLIGNKNIGVFLTPVAFFIISKFEDRENP